MRFILFFNSFRKFEISNEIKLKITQFASYCALLLIIIIFDDKVSFCSLNKLILMNQVPYFIVLV